jgi:hypothetical protein
LGRPTTAVHSRVTPSHHVAEIADGDTRIERGGGEAAVAEQRLDVAQIGAAAEQMRRARVPERMRREPETETAPVVCDARSQACRAEACPIAREQERGVDLRDELGSAGG